MADKNNTIPEMLGGRVRKRRLSTPSAPSKRAKTAAAGAKPSTFPIIRPAPAPVATSSAQVLSNPVDEAVIPKPVLRTSKPAAQIGRKQTTRQLRLSELLKRDRQQRLERCVESPSIVKGVPHMDVRRPSYSSGRPALKSAPGCEVSNCSPPRPSQAAPKEKYCSPVLPITETVCESSGHGENERIVIPRSVVDSAITPLSKLTSTRIRPAGSEAIIYSRAMLPASHVLLLDILAGIETAAHLLKTRQEVMTFSAVRTVVRKNLKRDFSFRNLSQLAHLVPEALCVLPSRNSRNSGREYLVLRLDNVDEKESGDRSKGFSSNALGGGAARVRRRLLHDRLLEHVREHHKRFLAQKGISVHESNMWHQDFDLESDVPHLGAPPLYPIRAVKSKLVPEKVPSAASATSQGEIPVHPCEDVKPQPGAEKLEKPNAIAEDSSCIPSSLLERVRARSAARNATVLAKNEDFRTNTDFLARLPATMDAVVSIFRNDRRQAFGWSQLITRLVKSHPRKWSENELERQLTSITEIADEWCCKISLSGASGRFAFRVRNEKKFSSQRAKVVSQSQARETVKEAN